MLLCQLNRFTPLAEIRTIYFKLNFRLTQRIFSLQKNSVHILVNTNDRHVMN